MNKFTKLSLSLGTSLVVLASVTSGVFAATPWYSWGKAMWKSASGAQWYNIYYKESGDKMWTHAVRNLPANAMSYNIMSLKRGKTYWYMVAAIQGGKEYWWSKPMMLPTWPMK